MAEAVAPCCHCSALVPILSDWCDECQSRPWEDRETCRACDGTGIDDSCELVACPETGAPIYDLCRECVGRGETGAPYTLDRAASFEGLGLPGGWALISPKPRLPQAELPRDPDVDF